MLHMTCLECFWSPEAETKITLGSSICLVGCRLAPKRPKLREPIGPSPTCIRSGSIEKSESPTIYFHGPLRKCFERSGFIVRKTKGCKTATVAAPAPQILIAACRTAFRWLGWIGSRPQSGRRSCGNLAVEQRTLDPTPKQAQSTPQSPDHVFSGEASKTVRVRSLGSLDYPVGLVHQRISPGGVFGRGLAFALGIMGLAFRFSLN